MKKLIAWVLLVTLLLGTFAGCGSNTTPTEAAENGAAAAIDYLKAFYKDGGTETFADFERFGIVRIAGVPYEVVWTADVAEDLVKAVVNDDGTVTIDVNESCEESTPYVLTATVTDDAGNTATHSWNYILPVGMGDDYGALVDMAYALEKDQALDFAGTLVGTVTAINTAWSDEYKNITVTIIVEGREDKPIMCYRLKGDGAQDLAVGDLITVTGILKNYNGTIEFDSGCTLDKVEKGAGTLGDVPTDPLEIVDSAYALAEDASLPYTATLTGTITSVDTPYSAEYKNITVTIQVEGCEDKPIMCYRLKGEGADTLMPGDVITVSGTLKNYKGTIEFDAGCQLLKVEKGENSVEIPTDPQEILEAAFALDYGESLPYNATLTGKIVGIGYKYSEEYDNITVTIKTGEPWYCVTCFRMKGEGVDKIWLDDVITVSGSLTNYNGTIEFDSGCQLVSYIDNPDPVAPSDPAEIIDAAYTTLGHRDTLPYPCSLTGTVTKIVYKWSDKYGNITVNMVVAGSEDQPIQCYRLTGNGAADIAVGDTITVYGWLKNYDGTIEFDQGCRLTNLVKGSSSEVVKPATLQEQLADAAAKGTYTGYDSEIQGEIVDEPEYQSRYGNYTFTVKDDATGIEVYCYGLGGNGYTPKKGDVVNVKGQLTAFRGNPQFDYTATLTVISEVSGGDSGDSGTGDTGSDTPTVDANSSVADVLAAAGELENGESLGFSYTLTGTITTAYDYSTQYNNITVIMAVGGTTVQCYRLSGTGADQIAVGDTITVTGTLEKNSSGYIRFAQGCTLDGWVDNTP